MTEKKTLKRSVKAVWDHVKRLRAERAKLYAPADLETSADDLERRATQLRDLAKQLSVLNAMPPDAIPATPPKRKTKKPTAKG